jgi:hypothetical protein
MRINIDFVLLVFIRPVYVVYAALLLLIVVLSVTLKKNKHLTISKKNKTYRAREKKMVP